MTGVGHEAGGGCGVPQGRENVALRGIFLMGPAFLRAARGFGRNLVDPGTKARYYKTYVWLECFVECAWEIPTDIAL